MARRRIESDPDLLAVCRRRDGGGDDIRVLVVRSNRIVEDQFTCRDSELPARLAAASCGRVRAVLPGAATLVRTIHVPASSPLQVESAIRLEAEARLLGSAPRHRTAIGILGGDGPHPTGIVVAWPEGLHGGIDSLEKATATGLHVERVPEIACLAQLAGSDPEVVVASLDGEGRGRTLSAVIPTSSGPVYRSSRGGDGDLVARLRPLVVESLLADGLEPSKIESVTNGLLQSVPDRTLSGVLTLDASAEDRLTEHHGSLSANDDPHAAEDRILRAAIDVGVGSLAPLGGLRADESIEEPGFIRSLALRLSDGRTAVAVAFAAILLLVLAPLASSGLRLAVMRSKVDDLSALEARVLEVENRQKIYRELDRQAWSVTKLLGDVSNLMPEQIETISISLSHGEPMTINGVAKRDGDSSGTDAVFAFNRRLRESGLFADAGPMPSIEPPDGRGYSEFKVTAELADPLRPLRLTAGDDYAVLSYSDRRFGPLDDDGYLIVDEQQKESRIAAMIERGLAFEKALPAMTTDVDPNRSAPIEDVAEVATSEATPTEVAATEAPAENGRPSRTRPPDRESSAGRSRGVGGSSAGEPASRGSIRSNVIEIPSPITPEEIAAMNLAEVKDRLSKVARGRSAVGISDEDAARLKVEFDLLLARQGELRDG
jgi:hypothetical protein